MDPLDPLTSLIGVIRYLRDVAEKVQQNREECRRLAAHANDVLRLVEIEIRNGASVDVLSRLEKLTRCVCLSIACLRQHCIGTELENQYSYWS